MTLFGANLAYRPVYRPGTMTVNPHDGSFRALVIGN